MAAVVAMDVVNGEGPRPADRMIVGEAPGTTEVEKGRPFVGRAGELLNEALHELGIARSTVYITNAVKVMPLTSDGKIRPPSNTEIREWNGVLIREIAVAHPTNLLALGRTAAFAIRASRDGEPGNPVILRHMDGTPLTYVQAWHPAYVLRQGGRSSDAYTDWLEQLRAWL